jgi:hypothetical protein
MDSPTEAMLTNPEVIAVNQHSQGNQARKLTSTSWLWTARATSTKGDYVALFNLSDRPLDMHYTWQELGLPAGKHGTRDLWLHKDLEDISGIQVTLAPHASALYRVE